MEPEENNSTEYIVVAATTDCSSIIASMIVFNENVIQMWTTLVMWKIWRVRVRICLPAMIRLDRLILEGCTSRYAPYTPYAPCKYKPA